MARDEAQATTTRYDSANERDAALEGRYRWAGLICPRATDDQPACCASLLQHVATHRRVDDYLAWCKQNGVDRAISDEALWRWEVETFGNRAYPAAHGLVLAQAKVIVFGDPYAPGERARRKGQFGARMPRGDRMSDSEWNEKANAARAVGQIEDRAAWLPYSE